MDIYGSLKELVSLILRKSGFTVTISAPTTTSKNYEFKLPNTDSTTSSVLVTDTHAQTLTNKTLDNPSITNLAGDNLFTDSHLAAAANIARSKIAAGTIGAVVINNGAGILSDEAVLAKSRGGFGIDMTTLTPGVTATRVIKVDNGLPGTDPITGLKVYQTVQAAINAAVTAGATNTNMHLIDIAPGTYIEDITLYDGIALRGAGSPATIIQGSISSHAGLSTLGAKCAIADIEFQHAPTTTTPSFNLVGAISTHLVNFFCQPMADVAITALHVAPAIGQTAIHGLCSVIVSPGVPFTSDIYAWENNGQGTVSIYSSSSYVISNQTAGEVCVLDEEGSGIRNYNNVLVYANMYNAAFSGTVKGFCTESVSSGERLSQGGQVRLIGAGSGTAIAFGLDTGTDASEYFFTGSTAFIDGFTNEYISYTSVNAVQKIWLNSVNKDLPKSGTGRSIITPYDEQKSGFVEWGAVTGGNYWSISGTTFTVVPAGVGVVRGAPVAFDAGQSISLVQGVNYIYMNSAGVIGKTSSSSEALYSDTIVLFQVLYDGTLTRVFKENHPYKFESAVSHAWHRLFGALLEGTGTIISQFGAASARTIQSAGADVLTDHGLDTTIPDSTGAAISLTLAYRGVGGLIQLGSTVNALPGQYNNGTVLSNTNNYVVWRIVVAKDNLEGSAQYFAIADTTTYANLAAANAAITNGTVASIPTELQLCEVVMVGYVIIDGDNTGAGTISSVISSRKTFGASFLGGSPSSTANLVSITDIAGPIIDTATTVQSALEEVNTNAVKKATSSTNNALARFDSTTGQLLKNGTVTQDDSGNLASVGTINSHAIPAGTDALVTADATQTLTNKTLTTPTIGNFTNANHDHSNAANGGVVVAASTTQQGAVTTGAQTLGGEKTFNDGLKSDTISEKTSAAGVTIDGGKVKDGQFEANSTDANLLPVGTTAQRSSAAAGRTRFNSTFGCLEVHDGTRWVQVPKAHEVSLINGTADLYTPETGVVAYEAVLYSSVGTATSITKVLVVNDNGSWTHAATEAGDTVVTVVVNASTGKLSLTATNTGTCKSRVLVLV